MARVSEAIGAPVSKRRNALIGVAAAVALVVLLLLSAILIAPKLIAVAAVQDEIRRAVPERFGVGITFERLGVSFVPGPRFDVDQATFELPAGVEGTVETVTAYPAILPLFIGELRLKELLIQRPAFTPLLTHVVQAPVVEQGVAQLQPLSGQGTGALVLSKDSTTAKVKVEASDIALAPRRCQGLVQTRILGLQFHHRARPWPHTIARLGDGHPVPECPFRDRQGGNLG